MGGHYLDAESNEWSTTQTKSQPPTSSTRLVVFTDSVCYTLKRNLPFRIIILILSFRGYKSTSPHHPRNAPSPSDTFPTAL